MSIMYDVAVIGAGPAGATLARLIDERYRVLLIDKDKGRESPEGGSPGKCCGGLLAPDAQRMLSKLGLGLPKGVLEDPQLFVVKSIDLREGLERYYQRHYINMNRKKFDSWLLSLVPTSVEIRTGCRLRSFSQDRGAFTLTLGEGGKTYTEKTRILVGADGACSRVRFQALGKQVWPKRYIAIQEWVEGDHLFPYFTSLFDPEITDFYCWTIPKGDHLIIGAALQPKRQPSEGFVRLKQKLRQYGFQYGRTVRREGAVVLVDGELMTRFRDGGLLLEVRAGELIFFDHDDQIR